MIVACRGQTRQRDAWRIRHSTNNSTTGPPKTTSKAAPNRTICARLAVRLLTIGSANTRR